MQQAAAETGAVATAKIAPPISVLGAELAGIHVPDLIQDLTLIYIALLVIHKAWRMWREWKTGRVTPDVTDELP